MDFQIAQDAHNYIVDRAIASPDDSGWEILFRQMDAEYINQYYRFCSTLDEVIHALKAQAEMYDRWALDSDVFDAYGEPLVDPYADRAVEDDEDDWTDDQEHEASKASCIPEGAPIQ